MPATRAKQEFLMRFMSIVISSQPMQGPTPALMEAMGRLTEREIKAGRMVDMGGLAPLQQGAHVAIEGGKLRVTDGPFVEAKEVIGGYAIFEFRDKAEALAMAREFMQLHLDHMPGWEGICELRPMIGHGVDMNCGEVQSPAHA
jgi:hypothetical protein